MDSIIFDVDGTLWNSVEPVAKCWNIILKEYPSVDLTMDGKTLTQLFGKTMTDIGNALFPSLPPKKRMEILEHCCSFENTYLKEHPGTLYDGVEETVKILSERYPLYIASNCQAGYIETMLSVTGLQPYIKDHLCFGDTLTSKGQTILKLMKKNNLISPIYVGDTRGDAEACREAGIPFLFVEYGFGDVPEAERKIRSFRELPLILSSWQ